VPKIPSAHSRLDKADSQAGNWPLFDRESRNGIHLRDGPAISTRESRPPRPSP
jgi:hypothetical protein